MSNSKIEAGNLPVEDNQNIQRMEIENACSFTRSILNCKMPNRFLVLECRPDWLKAQSSRINDHASYHSRYKSILSANGLGPRTRACTSCGTLHFITEKVKISSIARSRFQSCCKGGQVVLDSISEPSYYSRWLWNSEDRVCKNFRSRARQYNCAFVFTPFGYGADRRLEEQGTCGGIKSFAV